MSDLISRQAVLKLLSTMPPEEATTKAMLIQSVKQMDAPYNLVKDSQGLAKDLVNDCISRKAAIDEVINLWADKPFGNPALVEIKDCIEKLPPAQPERKRGKWHITDAYPHNVYCSECYTRFAQTHWAVWEDGSLPRNFCPNCGADMREDNK